jgi:SNF2 family DNA or RNA helicase
MEGKKPSPAPAQGTLVHWLNGPTGNVGLVTEVMAGGSRLRVHFDHGEEKIFAWPNAVIERMVFPEGTHVQIHGDGQIGRVESATEINGNLLYSIILPGGEVTMVMEAGVRRAVITDPMQLLEAGELSSARSSNLRLVASQLLFAHQTDDLSSLTNSRVEMKPHQVWVTHRVSSDYPHRYLLADEVGLGKTIEAGLIIKELKAREVVERILILAPSGIVSQWQFELRNKFNEVFAHYNRQSIDFLTSKNPGDNVWTLNDQVITSTAFASWDENRRRQIALAHWDLVIIDEAHHARRGKPGTGSTNLYKLAQALASFDLNRALLLLTATPLQLHRAELYSLVELLDPALFPDFEDFDDHCNTLAGLNRVVEQLNDLEGSTREELDDLLHSLELWLDEPAEAVEEQLKEGDGLLKLVDSLMQSHRLSEVMIRNRKTVVGGFMPRVAVIWPVDLTEEEKTAYNAVTEYCRSGYAVAAASQDNALGFLMATFQKLNSSSSYAVKRSLIRRIEKLDSKALPTKADIRVEESDLEERSTADALDPWLGWSAEDRDEEVLRLQEVVTLLDRIDVDSKTRVLNERLNQLAKKDPQAKVIIFTQSRDTQDYLREQIDSPWNVRLFHGQLKPQDKDQAVMEFRNDTGPQVLISTEAGGEGRNFQFCHILINYDLPWNPMRIEQRIGRLDRIGQKHPVTVINFSLRGTIEERVLEVLARRIRVFEETIGGLDPILGEVEEDLRRIFLMGEAEAERTLNRLNQDIESKIKEARETEKRLADFIMDTRSFRQDETDRLLNRKGTVGPDLVRRFVISALVDLGASIREEPPESGIYSIKFQGQSLIEFPDMIKEGITRRVTFDPSVARDHEDIDFLAIGHDLVDALLARVRDQKYGGRASTRLIRTDDLDPTEGWFFTFGLEFDGVTSSKELLAAFITRDNTYEEDISAWILERTGRLKKEESDLPIPPEGLQSLSTAHKHALELATKRLVSRQTELTQTNRERAQREKSKLERFYEYRSRAAAEKVAHAEGVLRNLERSEDPEVQKIIPVWKTNLENARKIFANLSAEQERRFNELVQQEQVKARQQLLTVSYVRIVGKDTVVEGQTIP